MLIFVTDRKYHFENLADKLRKNGIYLLFTSLDTALFTCDQKDTGAVLLDCVTSYQRAETVCSTLREKYPDLPIAVILPQSKTTSMLADRILYEQFPLLYLDDLLDFCHAHGFNGETLSTDILNIDRSSQTVRYLGYPLELSPRAKELLRCLIYRYPHPTTPDDLMSLCFYEKGLSISNLNVTIHTINRLAEEISPYPLILHIRDEGYVLSPYKQSQIDP